MTVRIPNWMLEKYDVYRGEDFVEARNLREEVDKRILKLAECYSVLPKIAEDGASPCSFAEELFFNKADAEVRLARLVGEMKSMVEEFSAKTEPLMHLAYESRDPGDDPTEAWVEKARKYEGCVKLQRAKIAEAERALRRSKEKSWPHGEPRGPFGLRPGEDVRLEPQRERNARVVRRLMGEE